MSRKFDVVATVGKYEKEGQTKYISRNVGVIIETKHGLRLKLAASFNPAGCERDADGHVWLALFEPRPREGSQQGQQQDNGFKDDDIVF